MENEEKLEEVTPVEVVQQEVVEEPEEGIRRNVQITLDTYNDFFSRGGVWQQLKTSVILSVIMVALLYFFGDRSAEGFLQKFLLEAAIYVGIILGVSVLWYFLFSKIMVKSQYKKSGISSLVICTTINNIGVLQEVNGQKVDTKWSEITSVERTENSLFFILGNRSAVIMSTKETFEESDFEYVEIMTKRKLGEGKFKDLRKKKKEAK